MGVAGTGEAATRALALLFALLAVPVSWWAGAALFDRRAAALAAAGAAGCPFLTYYAQETRMYSLVAVLSVLACASFVLTVRARRRAPPVAARPVAGAAALRPQLGALPRGGHGRRLAVAVAAGPGRRPRGRPAGGAASRSRTPRGSRASSSRPRTPRRRGRPARRRCTCSASPAACSATWRCRCWRSPPSPLCGAARCPRARAAGADRRRRRHGRLPRLAARARVGDALPRDPLRPAAARARRGARPRRRVDVDGARGRARRLAHLRPGAGQEQRADRRRHRGARAAPGRPRRRHAARAGAGALRATSRRGCASSRRSGRSRSRG